MTNIRLQLQNMSNTLTHDLDGLKNQLNNLPVTDPSGKEIQKKIDEKTKKLESLSQEIKIYNQGKFRQAFAGN